ncbi:MAG: hypothetical protein RLZZ401_229, partial [Pseudomonadota bacterium]
IHVFAQEIAHQWPSVSYHRISMPLRRPRWINQLWYATATWWATRRGFDLVHSHENTWHGAVQTVHVLPVWHNFFAGREGLKKWLRWLKAAFSPRLWTYLGLESLRFRLPVPVSDGARARRIVVTSDSVRRVMVNTFPRSASALSVITPGVDLPVLPTDEVHRQTARQTARRQLGVPMQAPCVLLVGNDFGKKGLPSLLKALCLLPAEVVLLAVGSAQRIPEFQSQAAALGLADRVIFKGALNDVTVAYRAADVLAHPTLEDTFAMVVLEAMAHGLPVMVSNAGYCGIASLLSDGENAVLLQDPRDERAMAQVLSTLLFQSIYREALGNSARTFAQAHQWAHKAAQQEQLYLELVRPIRLKQPA